MHNSLVTTVSKYGKDLLAAASKGLFHISLVSNT